MIKVGYSKTYPLPLSGCYEKICLEYEIETTDMNEVRRLQYALKKQVQDFHFESNKAAEKETIIANAHAESKEGGAFNLIDAINSCTDKVVLEGTYKYLARQSLEASEVYRKKLVELSNNNS